MTAYFITVVGVLFFLASFDRRNNFHYPIPYTLSPSTMAHKKAGGSTSLGRDSAGQRLGVKLFGGQRAQPGSIIIRQRGTKFFPGQNVRRGKDDTLYSVAQGVIQFTRRKVVRFDGARAWRRFVHVVAPTKKAI